jgi:hypothetical protein
MGALLYRDLNVVALQPAPSFPNRRGFTARRAAVAALSAGAAAAAALLLTGCGNMYRPVVSAISPVGPAGQPTKYAVAISNTNTAAVQDSVTGYTIANNVITVNVATPNPFTAGASVTLSGFPSSTFLNYQALTVLATGLSTTQFQASLIHGNATSTESATAKVTGLALGLVTFVDFSGDTVLSTPQILANPNYFQLNSSGTEGYVINAAGSLNFFGTSSPTSIITSTIGQTTLPANSQPISISAFTPSSGTSTLFIPEVATSNIAALNSGSAALYDAVTVPANPIYVVGSDGAARVYAISQGATPGTSTGSIAAIETVATSSLTVSATIPVGVNPVYGVMSSNAQRAYILNKGSGTVSVVNVINNALDSFPSQSNPAVLTSAITLPQITYTNSLGATVTTAPNPVWAGFSPVTNELIVLNQGDGIGPGSLSIINIPLCSAAAQPTNPNCNANNPVDATGFGTIASTVPVGVNPVMVSVLQDGSIAAVANAGVLSTVNAQGTISNAGTPGSVTIVTLASGTVAATIPGAPDTATTSPVQASCLTTATVCGHPNSISATTGTPTGKVYVTSSDSVNMTIIYTNTDTVEDHITLQGNGLRVLVTAP